MNTRKSYKVIIFIAIMILIDFFGKVIAREYSLPIWMDSMGTCITAYVCDPFCGAVVGFASNLMYGIKAPLEMLYGLTNIAIGITVGICARKKMFDTLFGTLSVSIIVTFFSVLISTPISLIFNHGLPGNMWGDGVVSYLEEIELNHIFAAAIGEFYVDFLDKVLTLLALYFLIKFVRFRRNQNIAAMLIPLLVLGTCLTMKSLPVRAEEADINVNNIQTVYSSDNGLPCGEANAVIQTNDGILWVGTYAGLYRYNGSEFKWMREYDSVRNVNCLFTDEEDRLWIGTNDNGFSIAINEKIVNVIDENSGLPSNSVRCIARSSDGYYYIGTTSSLQIMTLDGGLHMVQELPEIIYAHSIDTDSKGNVATVTNDGELFIINGENITASLRLNAEQEIFSSVKFSDDDVLYVGTSSNNIYRYDIKSGKPVKAGGINCGSLSSINHMSFTESGAMYVCADNGIGYVNKAEKFYFINTGNFNNSIDSMATDYQGNLWFTSSRLGLLRISFSPFSDIYRLAGISGGVSNSVTKWQGKLYVGTDNGLDIIDIDENKEINNKLTEEMKDIRIRCVSVDSDDNLWISTYGKGLIVVSKNGETKKYDSTNNLCGDWARVSMEMSDGTIVSSSDLGLAFFKNKKQINLIKYEDGLSSAMILSIAQMSDGRLLCGSDGDGIAIIKDGEVTGHIKRQDGLSSEVILRIVEDTVGNGAYIVTSNGLCYLTKNDEIKVLDKFPYFNNYDIWPGENGDLFVLGSAGIYVVNRDELFGSGKRTAEAELIDSKKGLKSALTANSWDYMDDKGNLYLACDDGVYRMNINSYGLSRKSYRMMISNVYLDGEAREIERGEIFDVGRDVSKIEIVPEVVNFTVEDPNVQYYLEGFDNSATIVPQSELSTITYTNLPSGTFRFHLCVLDSKSERIIEESVFDIKKENEIYDTKWFHAYMLIIAMLAVAWFTWFVARTQIQRTLNFQKKELAFIRNQVKMGNETILAIAKTVDAKDENTSQHSQRVSEYSVLIAKELGFSEEECENLKKAALLHDIGKIGIPDRVLNKPGRLTDEEYAIMKSHVTRGAAILKDFTVVEHAGEGAEYHHERYDGNGYPKGLKGEEIPLYGRIIGVADAFDAMTANRVYRKKLDIDYVINEMKRCSGSQFDPQMVDILLKLIDEKKIDVEALYGTKPESDEEEPSEKKAEDKAYDDKAEYKEKGSEEGDA
ncbi:MAG: HD domain-containing protein [Eubacterium sp.]|nr:HD domain-containing protein [Eubacterium sp.]